MEPITYDNSRGLSFPRLRTALWAVIVVSAIASPAIGLSQSLSHPYDPWYMHGWPIFAVFVATLVLVGAANVLAWIRVARWLARQEIVYRVVVIICLAVLFALLSFFAILGLLWLQLAVY